MNKIEKLIPELRFPEFRNDGEWEEKKLGEIGEPLMCKRVFKEQTTSNPENRIPFYKIGTFGREADAYISSELYNDFRSKYSFPNKGDILISASGTIGRLVVYDGSPAYFQDSNIIWLGNDEDLILNELLFYCYSNVTWQTSDGGIIKRLYNSDFRNIEINYPKNKKEQQKIASCLSSLDELIQVHTQKLEILKDHKKGLMQNLFPQEGEKVPKFRFPEFVNDGEWKTNTLEDIAIFSKGKGISKADIVEEGNLPCIRYGELYTHYNETIREIHSYTNLNVKDLVLSKANDVIIPASGETQIDIATASCVLEAGIALGGDLNIIRSKMNGVFLSYYLNNVKKMEIARMAQGISVVHLYATQLKTLKISIPKPKEQNKIAETLASLDELIRIQSKKIEQLKEHKKGLMQSLFPNNNF
jgi:type I restriction enzyme S subunit